MAEKQDKIETMKINGVEYVALDSVEAMPKLGKRSIVRCRNAGVHVGTVLSRDEHTLVLENANRIWRWRGAFTLSEMALEGVNRKEYTRIAKMLPSIELTVSDVCEVIPVAKGVDLTECNNE